MGAITDPHQWEPSAELRAGTRERKRSSVDSPSVSFPAEKLHNTERRSRVEPKLVYLIAINVPIFEPKEFITIGNNMGYRTSLP